MKKEVAKKWVKALRSGKYKQGQSYLKKFNDKKEPRHCCLGVLCELYNNEMKKNHKKMLDTDRMTNSQEVVTFNGSDCSLPIEVRRWADIKDGLGLFNFNAETETECLADLNDRGKKFKTIADIIEKNIENI